MNAKTKKVDFSAILRDKLAGAILDAGLESLAHFESDLQPLAKMLQGAPVAVAAPGLIIAAKESRLVPGNAVESAWIGARFVRKWLYAASKAVIWQLAINTQKAEQARNARDLPALSVEMTPELRELVAQLGEAGAAVESVACDAGPLETASARDLETTLNDLYLYLGSAYDALMAKASTLPHPPIGFICIPTGEKEFTECYSIQEAIDYTIAKAEAKAERRQAAITTAANTMMAVLYKS